MDRAHRAGGTVVKAAERAFWGGYAGYFRDPDGHLFGGDDLVMNMSMKARIDHVQQSPIDTPGAREGEVILVEFTLAGQSYQALNGGPHDPFNDAISLSVRCRDQAEVVKWTPW